MKTVVASLTVMLVMTACSRSSDPDRPDPEGQSDPCGFGDVSAEVVSQPEIEEVPEGEGNLVVDLSSSTRESAHVTVRLDGDVALDVRTPAVAAECSHAPVYSHEFRLPGDSVRLAVRTEQGQPRSITVPLDGSKRWVAVQPQDGFPIGLTVYDEQPAWG